MARRLVLSKAEQAGFAAGQVYEALPEYGNDTYVVRVVGFPTALTMELELLQLDYTTRDDGSVYSVDTEVRLVVPLQARTHENGSPMTMRARCDKNGDWNFYKDTSPGSARDRCSVWHEKPIAAPYEQWRQVKTSYY